MAPANGRPFHLDQPLQRAARQHLEVLIVWGVVAVLDDEDAFDVRDQAYAIHNANIVGADLLPGAALARHAPR